MNTDKSQSNKDINEDKKSFEKQDFEEKSLFDKEIITKLRRDMALLYDKPVEMIVTSCKELDNKKHPSKSTVSRFFNYHMITPSSARKIHIVCKRLISEKKIEDSELLNYNFF